MIILVKNRSNSIGSALVTDMYKKRYRVFFERMKWNVNVVERQEIDEFDNEHCHYLLLVHEDYGVYGGLRLIPTTHPYMMKEVFSSLVHEPQHLPQSHLVLESSRFFVFRPEDEVIPADKIRKASAELLAGVLKICLMKGIHQVITVTDLRVERIMANLGWKFQRLGDPQVIDNTNAVACVGEVSKELYDAFIQKNEISPDFHVIEADQSGQDIMINASVCAGQYQTIRRFSL